MVDDAKTELHPIVKKIAKSFSVDDGMPVMSAAAANAHMVELIALKAAERQNVALHLVALAQRFRDEAGAKAEAAIGLIVAFTVAAFDDPSGGRKAADLFANAGLAKEAATVIGAAGGGMKAPAAAPAKKTEPAVKAKRGLK
jgi:hypothetical protein